ncbi:MAG: rod shape-determining protein RodA [Patescibacteria group bacterium]|nr:rod shape-determining protein RodA [Patescibacteria group bacterium]MDW8279722.1 FtsW/RodA/SpoVE family cell cycle protein [bacterium]
MKKVIIPLILILFFGWLEIFSISENLARLQLLWIILGFLILIFSFKTNLRNIFNYPWFIKLLYLIALLLLLISLFFGPVIRGTKGWIVLGPFRFQPVEFAKIALVLIYANYFSKKHIFVASWKIIFESFILFISLGILVLLQPDLGSFLILFGIWFGFLLLSGLPGKKIITAILIFIILGIIGWNYFLKDYQKQRILAVFYPEKNALTINYSTIQSKIAIGSSGFWGKGFKQGTQTQLGFLTEPSTDFIFSALVEEWGLIVGIIVILSFLFLIFGIIKIGIMANNNFLKFICLGTIIVFGLHFVINLGSTLGILPVIGVPFPFLSYGGSNLLINFLLISIILSVAKYA